MAVKVIRKFRNLFDVTFGTPSDGDVVTYDSGTDKLTLAPPAGGGGGAPSGPAGGVLGGTYPNPSFAADMATQVELDAHVNDAADAHDASAVSADPIIEPAEFVQAFADGQAFADSTLEITVPAGGIPAGHTLVVATALHQGPPTGAATVTDESGNTYTSAVALAGTGGHDYRYHQLHVAPVTTALDAGDTITVTGSVGNPGNYAVVMEFQGLDNSNLVDETANLASFGSPVSSGLTATTDQADEMVVGAHWFQGATTWTPGTGFAVAFDGSADTARVVTQYRAVSATDEYESDGASSDGPTNWSLVVTLRVALSVPDSDVQTRLDELQDHVDDTVGAHAATAISIADSAGDFTATNVEGALAELQTADEADEAALATHIADAGDAHDASAISFSPTGTIAATDVQAAIAEVALEAGTGSGSGESLVLEIAQTAHGLDVGDWVRLNGSGDYVLAQADSIANAEVVGVVTAEADANNFTLTTGGYVEGLTGLTAGEPHFLDPDTAGAITVTEPSVGGEVSKPVLIADSTTSGWLFNMRGAVVSPTPQLRSVLSPGAATLPDGTTDNAAPAISLRKGTQTGTDVHLLTLDFDASADEHCFWTFVVPDDYGSSGTLRLLWMANATTGTCRWGAQVGCVTPGDADTPLEHALSTAVTVGTATNATEARRVNESELALNMDSAAPGDLITIHLYRDGDGTSGTDDLAVDAELLMATFDYVGA